MPLVLVSPAFAPGGSIPAEYTCDGADISPPLSWSGLPRDTGSVLVVIEDPDAPRRKFVHWTAYDLPPAIPGLHAGYHAGQAAAGLRQARNDFGTIGYAGPCPPRGAEPHHYVFQVLAIGRPSLGLHSDMRAEEVLRVAAPYVLERAELVGIYSR